jgi:hypothetical protein
MFAVETNELGEDLRTCIDGKQRCTSVVNFMDGKIPFVSPYTRERYWFRTTPEQKRGRLLPDSLKRRFEQIQLQAAEYREITDIQQRDLFRWCYDDGFQPTSWRVPIELIHRTCADGCFAVDG